jgi:hypothetical protein
VQALPTTIIIQRFFFTKATKRTWELLLTWTFSVSLAMDPTRVDGETQDQGQRNAAYPECCTSAEGSKSDQ